MLILYIHTQNSTFLITGGVFTMINIIDYYVKKAYFQHVREKYSKSSQDQIQAIKFHAI